ncbi:MAG: DUF4199 domain-containing protein [Bacteroidia bacterium]
MQNPPVIRTALNYGALSGLGSFIVFLALYFMGINPLGPASWAGAWVPVVFMVLSSRHYKYVENGGFLFYWQGFRIGLLTACSGALVYGVLSWAFVKIADPGILDAFKQQSLEALEMTEGIMKSMMGEAAYMQSIESINNMHMEDVAASDVFYKMFGGLLTAFITAAFMRRDPNFTSEE